MTEARRPMAARQEWVSVWRRCHLSLCVPLFCYALFLIWINPFFEYVVGDDWIYARSSYDLAVNHLLKIHDPSVASLLWQAVWGYLFTLPFGFSFSALHVSTITIFVVGVVFWYLTLRMYLNRELYVFAGTFLLIAIPQVPVLSITFNTDIHAMSYLLIALYFYLRYLRGHQWTHLAGGAIASSLGILVRQTIILVPASLWLTLWITQRMSLVTDADDQAPWQSSQELEKSQRWRGHKALRWVFHLLPLGVLCGFYAWINWVHGVPFVWRYQHLELFNFNRILTEIVSDPICMLHYSALFLLPVMLVLLLSRDLYRKAWALFRTRSGKAMLLVSTLGVVAATLFFALGRREWMPYLQGDSYLLAPLIPWNWKWVTVLTTLGSLVIAFCLLATLAETLLQIQHWVLSSFIGKHLVKRVVRRSVEGALALASLVVALGWARPVIMGAGNHVVEHLYSSIGAIGGQHGYPLSFWTDQVEELYRQFRWIGSGILLGLVPVVSFLAGNRKIEALLRRAAVLRLDRIHVPVFHDSSKNIEPLTSISGFDLRNLFLTLYLVLTVVYMMITGLRFDRYLIVFFPTVALVVFSQIMRIEISRMGLCVFLFAFMIFSAVNARAVLAPQETVWRAYNDLRGHGIAAEKIDAGLYVSNWFNYKPERYQRISQKERWWVDDPEYFIHDGQRPGYHRIAAYPYQSPFLGPQYLYILKRDVSTGAVP
jgi:hypothetical protein